MEDITKQMESVTINPIPVKNENITKTSSLSKELEIFLNHLKEKECKSPCYHHGLICCMSVVVIITV